MNQRLSPITAALVLGVVVTLALFWCLSDANAQMSVARTSAVITVCPDGTCDHTTIQAAVDAAGDGDTIQVAAGTYAGLSVRPRNDVTSIGAVTQVVYISKSVTIRGGYTKAFVDPPDPVANPVIVNPQGRGRGIYITGGISPTIEGLRITQGDASGLGGYHPTFDWDVGGGLYVISATATLRHCQVFSNTAGYVFGSLPAYGGGVFLYDSDTRVRNNAIYSNTAYEGGGLFVASGSGEVSGNTIRGNTATDGAGLYLSSNTTITGNAILSNNAERAAGGLLLYISGSTISSNTFSGNTAGVDGGGMSMTWSDAATIRDNHFAANRAGSGGGLHIFDSDVTLRGNTIFSNTATAANWSDGGGGVFLSDSAATLEANVFISNTAVNHGGGIFVYDSADTTLGGNRFVSNTAGEFGGGLFLFYSDAALDSNTILGNSANEGGGLYLDWSDATLTNHIIAENQAAVSGCGLTVRRSAPRLLHTTIAHNCPAQFGASGVHVTDWMDSYSVVELANTILVSHGVGISVTAGNTATLEATVWNANSTDYGGSGHIGHSHDYPGEPGFADADAGDYHIREASIARDKGVNAFVTTDIDGQLRPQGAGYDIGADEFHPLPGFAVKKRASAGAVKAGERLTYTLTVTNTGNTSLHARITDTLPDHVTPGGQMVWGPVTITLGDGWQEMVVVTVVAGYSGPLTNVVHVATQQGVSGMDRVTTAVERFMVYLPVSLRGE